VPSRSLNGILPFERLVSAPNEYPNESNEGVHRRPKPEKSGLVIVNVRVKVKVDVDVKCKGEVVKTTHVVLAESRCNHLSLLG